MAVTPIPVTPVARFGSQELTPGTTGEVDGNFTSGNEYNNNESDVLLVVNNSGVVSRTFTIVSIDDPYGRQEDIVHAMDADEVRIIGPLRSIAFGRTVHISIAADSTDLKFRALRFQYA